MAGWQIWYTQILRRNEGLLKHSKLFFYKMTTTNVTLAYIDKGKPAAAKFASTLMRSALDATATLRPLLLHCSL